jgi:hypothetical protein
MDRMLRKGRVRAIGRGCPRRRCNSVQSRPLGFRAVMPDHFLSHREKYFQVLIVRPAQILSEFSQHSGIRTGIPPCRIIKRLVF